MATIGHGWIGLAGAALLPPALSPKARRLQWVLWPGVMVFLAYALDLAEWAAVIANPLTTEAPWAELAPGWTIAGCAAAGCLVAAALGERRWPAIVLAAAVTVSHVALDSNSVREWIARLAGVSSENEYGVPVVLSECRVYGLATVLAILYARQRRHPASRNACLGLAVLAGAAACCPWAFVWGPIYLAASVYGFALWLPQVTSAVLWNAAPLVPVLLLALAHAEAALRLRTATNLLRTRRDAAAVESFQGAIRMRARHIRALCYSRMGEAYENLAQFREAEDSFQKSIIVGARADWADLQLGELYLRAGAWPEPRTADAAAAFRRLRDDERAADDLRERAERELAKITDQRITP